jgi:hypothetical protein
MNLWIIGAAVAGAGALLYFNKGGSAAGGGGTAVQQAQWTALMQATSNYDAQCQALGLTPSQAQQAFDAGLTPSEAASGLSPAGGNGGGYGAGYGAPAPGYGSSSGYGADLASGVAGGAAGALATAAMTAGPLYYRGETDPSTGAPVYRTSQGQPVLVDDYGQTWTFSEAA